ncbi:MAG: peptidoglycan-binding protein [Candidatus Omnitrophota bacterium]|nr:MAG: peptidoglycan-binding protein [Candidatus Omnitrophota bacterium]
MVKYFINWNILLCVLLFCCGCDLLLKVLHKEMAEEKQLFGNIYGHNSKVEDLQIMLKEIGYNPGPIDGKLGNLTRRAVRALQDDYELKMTGYVDRKTWQELNRIYETHFDSDQIDVKQIQSILKDAGFNPGPIDGKMGPKTKRAIQEFQKSKGLVSDGKVGSATQRELHKYIRKQ